MAERGFNSSHRLQYACVAELVYALVLETSEEIHAGSSPATRTNKGIDMSMDQMIVFKHKVTKLEFKVPKDNVQQHVSNGKVVLYTVSISPGQWEAIDEN